MKINSKTFAYTQGSQEYHLLEKVATHLASDAKCTEVTNVFLSKQASSDVFHCTFRTAETTPGIMPTMSTTNSQPTTQAQPQADLSQQDAQQLKSNSILDYIAENNVPVNTQDDVNNIVETVNNAQITPNQLTQQPNNADPTLVQKINQALNNITPV